MFIKKYKKYKKSENRNISSLYKSKNIDTILNKVNQYQLIFTHNLGGGSNKYLKDTFKNKFLVVKPINNKLFISNSLNTSYAININRLIYNLDANHIDYLICNYEYLMNIFENYNGKIFINNLYSYNLQKIVDIITRIYIKNKNYVEIIIHDYYLINNFPQPLEYKFNDSINLNNSEILNICDHIIAPSNWVIEKYKKYLPKLNITLKYHLNYDTIKINKYINNNFNNYNILIYGEIHELKGKDIIINLINNSEILKYTIYGKHSLNTQILPKSNVTLYGIYDDDDMLNIILKLKPSAILFCSLFAETFCYALKHAIQSGYPIICTNYGSFLEFSNYMKHKLFINPLILDENKILNFLNMIQ
jgi:hypothetical protein